MATIATPDSPKAFGLDVLGVAPKEAIPTALIVQASTRAGFVEGDSPAVRVPRINLDADVHPVPEGEDIPVADPALSEIVVLTVKVAELIKVSREQLRQPDAVEVIMHEIKRSLTYKADSMFAAQEAPVDPATWPPAGLIARGTNAGEIADNLDAVVDAVAAIESTPGGEATHILAHPLAYAEVRKYKTATDSEVSLVGAGTEAGPKTLLSLPVLTTSAMPEDKIVVLDKSQVLSAYGDVLLARSDEYFFGGDNVALRATFRFGIGLTDAKAVQVLSIPDDE